MKLRWKWLRRGAAIGGAVMSGVLALLALTGTWHRPAGWVLCEDGVRAREINWLDTSQDFLLCADGGVPRSFIGSYGRTSLASRPLADARKSARSSVRPGPSASSTPAAQAISGPEQRGAGPTGGEITTTVPLAANMVSAVLALADCRPGADCEESAARGEPDSLLACLHVGASNDGRSLVLVVTKETETPPAPDHPSVLARSDAIQGAGSSNCHRLRAVNEQLKAGEYWLWIFAGSTALARSRFVLDR